MIWDFFAGLGVWNWFVLAGVLLAIEVFAPGTFILWLGIAAVLTGVVTLAIDLTWQGQLLAFAFLAVAAVVAWWFYSRGRKDPAEPVLHRRADLHIGRIFTLEEPIIGGTGRIRIDDSVWRVSGPDLPAGARVRVASTDGAMLNVQAA